MKPIIGLIELPTSVIADPMFGMTHPRVQLMMTNMNVTMKFYFFVIPSLYSL